MENSGDIFRLTSQTHWAGTAHPAAFGKTLIFYVSGIPPYTF
jgi:hypothetical protein